MTIKQLEKIEELCKSIEMLEAPRVIADYCVMLLGSYVDYDTYKMIDTEISRIFNEYDEAKKIDPTKITVTLSEQAKEIIQ